MKTRFFVTLLGASTLAVLSDGAAAHGGMYRGPQDTVPPSPGGGGRPGPATPGNPTTGQPVGPSAPAPGMRGGGNPTTPGGGPGSGPGQRGRTTGGVELDGDLSTWNYWWEFNKDAYLRLKDAVHRTGPITGEDGFHMGGYRFHREETLKPTNDQLRNDVLPALHRAIESTDQRDIASSCMVAMAKIGQDHPEFTLVDVFKKRLQRPDQEIRETAALAIGIAARIEHGELRLLVDLANDTAGGRQAVGGEVDVRTRSFAAYGIGLLAHEHSQLAIKREAFEALRMLLRDERSSNRNLKVAAIQAIGILDIGSVEAGDRALRAEAIDCLTTYFDQALGAGEQLIQAHCPTALARLVGRSSAASALCKQRFAAELRNNDDRRRRSADLQRSSVLALGQLCGPHDDDKSQDAEYSKLLWQIRLDHRDEQTRNFAVLALGQIGGAENRKLLLDGMPRAGKAMERPWFALALGVMAYAGHAERAQQGLDPKEDRVLGERLAEQFGEAREPGLRSALAVALGLARHLDAAPAMQECLLGDLQKEEQAGYLCLGLALMDDRTSVETLHKTIAQSARRPILLQQAAVALGLLGDKTAAETLRARLADENGNLATFAAFASALGRIGDRRSILPLQAMLFDESRSELTRAFAAVAIGGVADRAALPWYAKIAANINYRAAVETLTNQQSGILDIL